MHFHGDLPDPDQAAPITANDIRMLVDQHTISEQKLNQILARLTLLDQRVEELLKELTRGR